MEFNYKLEAMISKYNENTNEIDRYYLINLNNTNKNLKFSTIVKIRVFTENNIDISILNLNKDDLNNEFKEILEEDYDNIYLDLNNYKNEEILKFKINILLYHSLFYQIIEELSNKIFNIINKYTI